VRYHVILLKNGKNGWVFLVHQHAPLIMYSRVTLSELELRDIEDIEPGLKATGYELQPEKMRPSVWEFEAGDSNTHHRQREQEELYFVLDGQLEMEVDDDVFEIAAGEFVIVSPESWRQLTAREESTVFIVGAPNVKDDAIDEE
jgi:quercetin dioxygenase-like cupin family protein